MPLNKADITAKLIDRNLRARSWPGNIRRSIASIVMCLLQLSVLTFANEFEVTKDVTPGYYDITDLDKVKDTDGHEHIIRGGSEMADRQRLTEVLSRAWGSGDETERKIIEYIKSIDATKRKPRMSSRSAAAQKGSLPLQFTVEKYFGDFGPYIFDSRHDGRDVMEGVPLQHNYRFIFFKKLKDINNQEFTARDNEKIMSKEDLLEREAELNKNIGSPLTNYDASAVKEWQKELTHNIEPYLKGINELEVNPEKEEYLKQGIPVAITAVTKRPPNSSYGLIEGSVTNNGNKVLVRLEITISFFDANKKIVSRKTYALPTDSYETLGIREQATGESIPDDTFILEPNTSKNFSIKVFDADPGWVGEIEAKASNVFFANEYRDALTRVKDKFVAQNANFLALGYDDQVAAMQSRITEINEKLSKL
jgi:hypothetical protein